MSHVTNVTTVLSEITASDRVYRFLPKHISRFWLPSRRPTFLAVRRVCVRISENRKETLFLFSDPLRKQQGALLYFAMIESQLLYCLLLYQ